jgi:hypothetical protein
MNSIRVFRCAAVIAGVLIAVGTTGNIAAAGTPQPGPTARTQTPVAKSTTAETGPRHNKHHARHHKHRHAPRPAAA